MTQSMLTLSNVSSKTLSAPSEGASSEVKGEKSAGFLSALHQSLDGSEGQGESIKLTPDGKTLLVDGQAIDAEAMLADGVFSEAEMEKIADMTAMEESQSLLMRLNQAADMLTGKTLPAGGDTTALSADALPMSDVDSNARVDLQGQEGEVDKQALLAELSKALPDEVSAEEVLAQLSPEQLAALVAQVKATQDRGAALEQGAGRQVALDSSGEMPKGGQSLPVDGPAIKWAAMKAQQENQHGAAAAKMAPGESALGDAASANKESALKDWLAKEGATTKTNELADKLRQASGLQQNMANPDVKGGATGNPNAASMLAGQNERSDHVSKAALKAMAEQAVQTDAALAAGSAASAAEGASRGENLAQQLASSLGTPSANAATVRQDIQVAQTAQAPLPLGQTPSDAGAALTERINVMLSKNLKQVDIRLDPPELGRMQIKLGINNDQASVHITVANQQARDAVEQAMPRLRDMLQQQGLQLAQGSVQQQDSGAQQMASGQHGDGAGNAGGAPLGTTGPDDGDDAMLAGQTLNVSHSDRAVDYYA
ncbi:MULTISPECIES: flagellar hook-length control protein FliK [unclassified Salinivibrio]|uniref:flagellar hook-length control protein FliK n=1 Tax=unclassified Salinivibrio TaxID=2636825 RepID=UPI00128C395D|nr:MULTISPECIES: flagellar hook-length control protein FliK [unclassified Salinivibrio]MPS32945.1 flagellar hook-length control protein FliK [Salinivibrio sp. VYel7]MPX91151.1 flagellar hook-length control protein FliK [Salinivibrio sp. VYel1]MPX94332.1 flagellar hook-length control protein FliK [Salinivibrio sp. VYel9]MPX96236.1 flagellar hook-length control protein FliK [Salinivibrio sp. VYel6]MPY00618.1 flagellar hook-length control protein FliK [Salinivibrio sp. VYel4]